MTISYHGSPITPREVLLRLAGRHFCVSFAAPADIATVDAIGQSVMLDNGAFSMWRTGKATNWPAYYDWCDRWLDRPTTWAVIPDVIDGGAEAQDDLRDAVDRAIEAQRQIAHTLDRVGQPKAESVRTAIAHINPDPVVEVVSQRADAALLERLVAQADVVIDCTDNFATRQAVNAACVHHRKPLVSGAAIRMDGQVSVYDTRQAEAPCYACLFPPDQMPEETRCATLGVFAPLVGIIGTVQAAEALKILSGMGSQMAGRLLMLDGRALSWTDIRLQRDPGCPVCGVRCTGA